MNNESVVFKYEIKQRGNKKEEEKKKEFEERRYCRHIMRISEML